MKSGVVVCTKIEELCNDEEMQSIIGSPNIYGKISNEEEYYKGITLNAWAENWVTEYLPILGYGIIFNLCCGIEKTKLELMMYRGKEIPLHVEYPLVTYFEKNKRGEWSIKPYVPSCELCGGTEYDRMEQKRTLIT